MTTRPIVLLVNDDGVHAPGLKALREALAPLGDLWVFAPHMERSANSHAITIHHPIFVEQISSQVFAVEGTPVDCVKVAMNKILPRRPEWVVSGINRGANLAQDTLYSGTCAAALEGAIFKTKSMAISLHGHTKQMNYSRAANIALNLLSDSKFSQFPGYTLNLNVPEGENIKGLKIASIGQRLEDEPIIEATDPRGRPYYWLGGGNGKFSKISGSDLVEISQGYATLSILNPSLYHEQQTKSLEDSLKGWTLRENL